MRALLAAFCLALFALPASAQTWETTTTRRTVTTTTYLPPVVTTTYYAPPVLAQPVYAAPVVRTQYVPVYAVAPVVVVVERRPRTLLGRLLFGW